MAILRGRRSSTWMGHPRRLCGSVAFLVVVWDAILPAPPWIPMKSRQLLSKPHKVFARSTDILKVERRIPMRLLVRRIMLGATLVGSLLVLPGPAASAHVHGITPLLQCSVVPANAGANQTDSTPAAAANGGPIIGLIPRDVGSSPLDISDGGFTAPVQCP